MTHGRHMPTLAPPSSARFARLRDEPATMKWVRRLCIVLFAMYAVPGLFASYRAWVQVRSLELILPATTLRSGDTIRVHAVSWARTTVTVRLLLVQAGRVETLAVRRIPSNVNASIDARWRRDSIVVPLTAATLAGFTRGTAAVHASAVGQSQWLRTPPPLFRQTTVQLDLAP